MTTQVATQQDDIFNDLDEVLSRFDGATVEGGVDVEKEEDNCEGGACKI